jgi:hypothetical protein
MRLFAVVCLGLALVAEPALAYIGPGAGISLLGSLFGLVAAIFVGLGVVLFWPIRRLMRRNRAAPAPTNDPASTRDAVAGEGRAEHRA